MGVYIKGMEMPKGRRGIFVCVCPDGTAIIQDDEVIQTTAVELPADDVIKQRTGKWETEICDDGYGAYNLYKCDQCGDLSAQPRNYCRECGARMVSDEVYSNI